MANIKFGTDGWRAILGADFNDENFTLVTNAIGKYVYDNFGLGKLIIIGYDPRKSADSYAEKCANILAAKGFSVKLSKSVVPTPVLAYNAGLLGACAIMFTASHNPPEYLGMKFIPDYAGPATDDITSEIVANIGTELDEREGSVEKVSFFDSYELRLEELIDFEKIKSAKIPFIYDGLYSATIGYFDKILENKQISFEAIRLEHDSNFGGGMPDPKPKFLTDLIGLTKEKACIGFANDGDGDRFGVVDETGEYVSPNEIIPILAKHLIDNKGYQGAIVKTVGSSLLIEKVAEKLGVDIIETAVGFKHVGDAMRKNQVIIGGEESGGLSIGNHIPEKDGIIANLLVLEAMAYSGKSLKELREDLYKLVDGKTFLTDRIDLKLSDRAEITRILDYYKSASKVAEFSILRQNTIDGVKLYLSDTTSILIRPSGTEPLLRIYFETDSKEVLDALKKIDYQGF